MKIVYANITSWVGISIGAYHVYLKMVYYDEEENRIEERIDSILTAKQAKELNQRERDRGSTFIYKKGQGFDGFWSYAEAHNKAIKWCEDNVPEYDVLLEGSSSTCSVQYCIKAKKPGLKDKINKLYKRADKIHFYEKKEHEDEMEKIDNKYWRITGQRQYIDN